jgi:glycosyltransferase involved in cell wall biosynthesis
MFNHESVAVLIPALNEQGHIAEIVSSVRALQIDGQIVCDTVVVCDNASTDRTAENAEKAGAEVVYEKKPGYGAACQAMLVYLAAHNPPDLVVFLNADGAENIGELPNLLEPLQIKSDLVIGSRTLGKSEKGAILPQQRFGNFLACALIRLFWQSKVTDLGPYRSIRFKKLLELDMQDRDFGWTIEMQLKAIKRGLSISEIPVTTKSSNGPSKISGTLKGCLGAAYKILGYILYYALLKTMPRAQRKKRKRIKHQLS